MFRAGFVSLLAVILFASPAAAQRDRLLVEPEPPTEWGVTFSFLPNWFVPGTFTGLVGADPEDITGPDGSNTLEGSTWSIGFARGRALGGDWGFSFTQQRISKGSVIDRSDTFSCGSSFPQATCRQGERLTFTDVTVIGPEVHFHVPFVTIKERVQVGVVLAGGVGAFRGTGVEERFRTDFTSTGEVQTVERVEGDITEIATDIYFAEPYTFYGRAEPGVAFIVSPRLRLFAGAGFHYPGMTTFAVRATVFFPRRVS